MSDVTRVGPSRRRPVYRPFRSGTRHLVPHLHLYCHLPCRDVSPTGLRLSSTFVSKENRGSQESGRVNQGNRIKEDGPETSLPLTPLCPSPVLVPKVPSWSTLLHWSPPRRQWSESRDRPSSLTLVHSSTRVSVTSPSCPAPLPGVRSVGEFRLPPSVTLPGPLWDDSPVFRPAPCPSTHTAWSSETSDTMVLL